jgi:Tfp pilus assembly protein PilN
VKELVDRRAFSWTGLLSALEKALPPTVRLVSITPSTAREATVVALTAVGRSAEDAITLVKALQASPAFEGAFLDGVSEAQDGVQISCSVRYVGKPRAAAVPGGPGTATTTPAAAGGTGGAP